ncbi:MAG: substrate-binding domain-containing protein [Anaerolineae bacterium]
MVLITVAHRCQGLIVAPGNPLRLEGVADLAREGLRPINRNRGSGTRLWLDRRLREARIQGSHVRGYDHEVSMHTELAGVIAAGRADAGVGLQAAAEALALDFVPPAEERFDLVLSRPHYEGTRLRPALDGLHSGQFWAPGGRSWRVRCHPVWRRNLALGIGSGCVCYSVLPV